MVELTKEMAQHGLDAASIASTIAERCNQLLITSGERESLHGMKLAGETAETSRTIESGNKANSRDLALAAAERRFREQQDKDKSDKKL